MPDPVTKRCSRCGEVRPRSEFGRESRSSDGLFCWCRPCRREWDRRRYAAHRDEELERKRLHRIANLEVMRERDLKRRAAMREQVFAYYGDRCACCGTVENLTIDHVNGDGAQHRQELYGDPQQGSNQFCRWLIKQGFPPGYQTLCRPCNISKARGERCRLDHAKET